MDLELEERIGAHTWTSRDASGGRAIVRILPQERRPVFQRLLQAPSRLSQRSTKSRRWAPTRYTQWRSGYRGSR
jgi:hypothetical protein